MTEQSDKPSVEGLMELVADALRLILPMAKGYAAAHPVGANAEKVEHAQAVLAALAGPLEQPQEPQSGQENLAQASGVCDLQTALPRWIPVSDGFPRIGYPVLVTYSGASGCACYGWMDSEIDGGMYWEIVSPDDGSIWRSDGDDEDSVTHWAEVPPNAHGASWSAAAREARVEPVGPSSSEPPRSDKPAASSESSVSVPKEPT